MRKRQSASDRSALKTQNLSHSHFSCQVQLLLTSQNSFCFTLQICHSRGGDINPVKIRSLIEAYVEKVRKLRGAGGPGGGGGPGPGQRDSAGGGGGGGGGAKKSNPFGKDPSKHKTKAKKL